MICKDCYHCDVCHLRISLNMDYDEVKDKPITEMEKRCEYFKDKSRIIELPCKVGDEAYYISIKRYSPLSYKLLKAKVINFNINRNGIYVVELKTLKSDYTFTLDIRKAYFDKSEAEAKLKELNNGTT